MQLKICNVAKIKDAAIEFDGITVIAGENNTGKSTIGKVVYSIFNSMYDIEEKILREKRNKIESIIRRLLQNRLLQKSVSEDSNRRSNRLWARKLTDVIMDIEAYDEEVLLNTITNFFDEVAIGVDFDELIKECVIQVGNIVNVSDEKLMLEVVTRWFNRVFENQVSPLNDEDEISEIELTLKEKVINFSLKNNRCILGKTEINIQHEAFYIDNPFIIDYMSNPYLRVDVKSTDAQLLSCLEKKDDIFDDIFETIMAKEKLGEIEKNLSGIVDGKFVENQEGEYCLSSPKYNKPINVKNLSTGLKSFALIKRLLENGSLKEQDVLILDEPEIHLHPEWQLAYAEIIVLLQKQFDLTVIITTHSPYFLDAIDVFSEKYEISDKVKYYLAESEKEKYILRDVTNNIDAVYKKLSDPLQKLESLRYKLV